jgi:transposase
VSVDTRRRQQLVRTRTAYILSVQNQVVRQTGRPLLSNAVKRLDRAAIDKLKLPADVGAAMAATVEVVRALGAEIEKIEARLLASQSKGKNWKLINSVPGIGKTLGAIILLETGTIERFASPGNFASYARCVDSIRVSNGKKKGEGNTKNGNKHLAWAFVEAAHFAARFYPPAKRFYDKKKARTNGAVATKALAHKLARATYHVLKDGVAFDMSRCFAS